MKQWDMSAKTHTQNEITQIAEKAICDAFRQMNKIDDSQGIPKEGLTIVVLEIGFGGRVYDLSLVLTPEGIIDEFGKNNSNVFEGFTIDNVKVKQK